MMEKMEALCFAAKPARNDEHLQMYTLGKLLKSYANKCSFCQNFILQYLFCFGIWKYWRVSTSEVGTKEYAWYTFVEKRNLTYKISAKQLHWRCCQTRLKYINIFIKQRSWRELCWPKQSTLLSKKPTRIWYIGLSSNKNYHRHLSERCTGEISYRNLICIPHPRTHHFE